MITRIFIKVLFNLISSLEIRIRLNMDTCLGVIRCMRGRTIDSVDGIYEFNVFDFADLEFADQVLWDRFIVLFLCVF